MHKRCTEISINLENKNVNKEIIEKCNVEYVRLAQSGYIKKPYNYTKSVKSSELDELYSKTLKKMRKHIDTDILEMCGILSEIMEKYKIGLRPYLNKDQTYIALNDQLIEQRSRVNSKVAQLIEIYLNYSYGINNVAMLYAYAQNTILKDVNDKPIALSHPIGTFRNKTDDAMFRLLSQIEDEIIKSVS
jgi:hypothetical protein